ncbi:MAG TPA: ABC transporter permease [Dinghuibacter sp.]|uniref:ABC transporter permease n=1 Tax=Dinghuibacter sp. TaxID=2024697 RepID=UPI002CA4BBA3|nr:ABC transporter permease [Dinghuibacter sp.]HTJ14004.1 ABC transporter permease [Dinghuibacter sp.]
MTSIPSSTNVLGALFRADMTTQWRNRRSAVLSLLVPVIMLISFKNFVSVVGAAYVMSTSITIGIAASCLMGYTNALARDRDKGIFQRLRVAPMPTWAIMMSRLGVQLVTIVVSVLGVYVIGFYIDHIQLTPAAYGFGMLAALIAASAYLGLGQLIVGLVKNPETVNSTTRLVYLSLIIIGLFGERGGLGEEMKTITKWSPYGTVKSVLAAALEPGAWTHDSTIALLATLGYAVVFTAAGIRNFSWTSR